MLKQRYHFAKQCWYPNTALAPAWRDPCLTPGIMSQLQSDSVSGLEDESSTDPSPPTPHTGDLDPRQWTPIHMEAAGKLSSASMLALTPPQTNDHMAAATDVDVRGPGECQPPLSAPKSYTKRSMKACL